MENSNGLKNTLGGKVKYYRQKINYTIERFSEETGISIEYIKKLEHGERENASFPVIERLASVLDISINDLVDW